MDVRVLTVVSLATALVAQGCDDTEEGPSDAQRTDVQVFDMGTEDSGGGGAGGGGPTEEHLRISYVKSTTPRGGGEPTVDLLVYDFEDDEEINLTRDVSGADGVNCRVKACKVSPDMSWIGWMSPVGQGGFELWAAPVDVRDRRVRIDGKRLIADSVNTFDFTGDLVVYSRGQAVGTENTIEVWVEPVAGEDPDACPNDDEPTQCKQFVGQINADGGFRVTDFSSLIILIRTTLSTMTVDFFNLRNGANQTLHTFGEQGGTGSQFSGRLPVALAPDATYLAVFTRNEFIWRAQTLIAVPNPPPLGVHDLFEVPTAQQGDCIRPMPYNFNEVRFDPVFTADAEQFYFLAHGNCSQRPGSESPTNRPDFDILRLDRNLSGAPVNITNNPRINNWSNHDIGDFDLDASGTRLAFTASRPNNATSRAIWMINPETGEYACSRGPSLPGPDGRTRCEFIFDDSNGVDVVYREVKFHTVDVPTR